MEFFTNLSPENQQMISIWGARILYALGILLVAYFIAKMVAGWARKGAKKFNHGVALEKFFSDFTFYLVMLGGAITALGQLGIQTTSFIALLGSAGLAIGLAVQGSLSNLASGLFILFLKPYVVNDIVEIAGKKGKVSEISLSSTRLLTPSNELIIVPNSMIVGNVIMNFTKEGTWRGDIPVGVAYGTDHKKVMEIIKKSAERCDLVLDSPEVTVAFTELASSSINFSLRPWSKTDDFLDMIHEVRCNVYEDLNEAGIEIPFDQLVVHKVNS